MDEYDVLLAELTHAEQERGRLINARDWSGLDLLLGDDLAFIHSSGKVSTKAEWTASLRQAKPYCFRDNLNVRLYHGAAMTTGRVIHVFVDAEDKPVGVLVATVLQTWVKRDERWQMTGYIQTKTPIVGTAR